MSRVLTFGEALTAIMALTGGIATLVFAVFSWVDSYGWQSVAFTAGGTYAVLAGFVRLTGR
jgi:hypothetical protein